ncbi:MAG: ThuA domain-containing protein [Oligoflexus sp.]|nr:ThuA domain-containing protein [Oligoflexus sp.]
MSDYHPLSCRHEFDGGRAWYTGMGHTDESYADPIYIRRGQFHSHLGSLSVGAC